jgi:predicted nucleic acid-binding protein
MTLVIDASVALKWFLRSRAGEDHGDRAAAILADFAADRVSMVQPPHFSAEVASVLARRVGDDAKSDLKDLQTLAIPVADDPDVYLTAVDICLRTGAHLFDTLYHATALHHPGARLVTADRRYFQRAQHLGQIVMLGDYGG